MNKINKIITNILMVICILGIIISGYNIIIWYKDSRSTKKITEKYEKPVIVKDDEKVEIIEQQEEVDTADPYWDYIKMNLIDADFNELKRINSDIVGWIQVNGTNINYPFVQTDNNKYYLEHSITKEKNGAGWIFLDYRNNIEALNKNTILYGHNRMEKIMFGTLSNLLTNGWLEDQNNYIIKMSTEKENTLWQIFSVYNVKATDDYLKTNFSSDEEYQQFLSMILTRSQYNFNTNVSKDDVIITLSTCHNLDSRTVVHAKLIKRQKK